MTVDFSASATLASIQDKMVETREREKTLRREASAVWSVQSPAFAFNTLPFVPLNWGPNTGYAWAIQRISIGGFGAATDFVNVYLGLSAADVQFQNARWSFSVPIVGEVATWNPGRTGFVLMPDQGIILGGTFTGTTGYCSVDVIQLETWMLPDFLL
jgi:hypothetical protein